jgi:hypothetical protein
VKRFLERGGEMEAVVERRRNLPMENCVAAVSENYLKLLVHLPRGGTRKAGSLLSVGLTAAGTAPFDAEAEIVVDG